MGIILLGVQAQQVPGLLHMRRQRRGDIEKLSRWTRHDDPPCVQMQALLDAAWQFPILDVEILGITHDWMPHLGGMDPQLMCAPCHGAQRQP
jgi:hypothetical protein